MGLDSFKGESNHVDRRKGRKSSGIEGLEYTPSDIQSSNISHDKMKGLFVGLVIGEGCFTISIKPERLRAVPKFTITQHEENLELLEYMQETIGLGEIQKKPPKDHYEYRMTTHEDCKEMAEWFEENAGGTIFDRTAKYKSFKLWCECLSIIIDGVSGDKEAIIKLAELRDGMNRDSRGRTSEEIKEIVNQQ